MGVLAPVPTAELERLRADLLKYSEDQPRVPAGSPEGGEFAGGPDSWTSKDDARAWFARAMPETKIDASDIAGRLGWETPPGVVDKMSLANLRQFAKAYERVAAQYPRFAAGLKVTSINVRSFGRGNTLAAWMGRGVGGRVFGMIQISPNTARQPAALARLMSRDSASNWHPPGCDDFQAVVEHELGHAFANHLVSSGALNAPGIPGAFMNLSSSDPSPAKSGWGLYDSGYAQQNAAEWFAEQFSGALAAGRPLSAANNWGFERPGAPKAALVKYSEDQPRGEDGRWTVGGGGWPAPDLTAAGREDALSAWTGVHYADVRAFMQTGGVREGFSPEDDPIHGISRERAAQAASTLTAMVAAGTEAPPLWRGINVDAETLARLAALRPGERFDLALTSWSAERGVAEEAAMRQSWVGDDETGHRTDSPVVLTVEGARGVDVSASSFYPSEREWLTDGRFTVVSAASDGRTLRVALAQAAVWDAPSAMEGMKAASRVPVGRARLGWFDRLFDAPLHAGAAAATKRDVSDEERVPAGEPGGGQWTSGGGGSPEASGYARERAGSRDFQVGDRVVNGRGEVGTVVRIGNRWDPTGYWVQGDKEEDLFPVTRSEARDPAAWATPRGFTAGGVVPDPTDASRMLAREFFAGDGARTYQVLYDASLRPDDPSVARLRDQMASAVYQNGRMEADTGRLNAWNGAIIMGLAGSVSPSWGEGVAAVKEWTCSIRVAEGWQANGSAQDDGLLVAHELAHGISAANPDTESMYSRMPGWEEGVAEGYARALLDVQARGPSAEAYFGDGRVRGWGAYRDWVNALDSANDTIRQATGQRMFPTTGERLAFYRSLLTEPLAGRASLVLPALQKAGFDLILTGSSFRDMNGAVVSRGSPFKAGSATRRAALADLRESARRLADDPTLWSTLGREAEVAWLIATAGERPRRALKYDDSEPRDERGRWTDGGASGAARPVESGWALGPGTPESGAFVRISTGEVLGTGGHGTTNYWLANEWFRGPDVVLTHSHPDDARVVNRAPTDGRSLSKADVMIAIGNDLGAVRAVSGLYEHQVTRPPGGWPSERTVSRLYDAESRAYAAEVDRRALADRANAESIRAAAEVEQPHAVLQSLADKYGLPYERVPRGSNKAAVPDLAKSLRFLDRAKQVLRAGFTAALLAGAQDAASAVGDDPGLWDESDFADEAGQLAEGQTHWLAGLASLLALGALTEGMLDSRAGLYASGMYPAYETGFADGIGAEAQPGWTATWRTEGDGDVCQLCADRDGDSWPAADGGPYPGDGGFGDQCLLPGQEVVAPPVSKVYRRTYDGDVVRLRTSVGGDPGLAVTPHHPILTLRGWVPAHRVEEGDYLVCGRLDEGVALADADVQHRPAAIEEVYRAAAARGQIERHTGLAGDFHGDGVLDGEVDVVPTGRALLYDREAASREPRGEHVLPGAHEPTCGLALAGDLGQRLLALAGASPRTVGGGGQGGPSLRADTLAAEPTGLGGRPDRRQAAPHGQGVDPERPRDRLDALPGGVAVADGGREVVVASLSGSAGAGRLAPSPEGHAGVREDAGDAVAARPVLRRELKDGSTVEVSLAQVVGVDRGRFSGHVYNLATETGWYLAGPSIADGAYRLVVSNCDGGPECRCAVEYTYDGDAARPADPVEEPEDIAAASTADLVKLWRSLLAKDYNPDQPRGSDGRWEGGAVDLPTGRSSDVIAAVAALPRDADPDWSALPTPVLLRVAAILRKYSADQERDDRGRWTQGSADAAVAAYRDAHPETRLALGGSLKTREIGDALAQLGRLQDRFPTVRITSVQVRDLGPDQRTTVAKYVTAAAGSDSAGRIVLNAAYWTRGARAVGPVGAGLRERLYGSSSPGFHPPGCDTPEGYMTHEFGHAVEYQTPWQRPTDLDWGVQTDYQRIIASGPRGSATRISGYGRTSGSENFAEVFSAAYTPTSRATDNPGVQAVYARFGAPGAANKVDFFTDEDGVVHPIRGSDGYEDEGGGGRADPADALDRPLGTTWSAAELKGLTMAAAESRIAGLRGGETAVVFGADGRAVFAKSAAGLSVPFSDEQIASWEGATLTHNHPDGLTYPEWDPRHLGNCLSKDDIALAIEARLAEVRAVAPEGTWSLKPGPDGWGMSKDEFRYLAMGFDAQVRAEFTDRIYTGYAPWGATQEERIANAEHAHAAEVDRRMAAQYGWTLALTPA